MKKIKGMTTPTTTTATTNIVMRRMLWSSSRQGFFFYNNNHHHYGVWIQNSLSFYYNRLSSYSFNTSINTNTNTNTNTKTTQTNNNNNKGITESTTKATMLQQKHLEALKNEQIQTQKKILLKKSPYGQKKKKKKKLNEDTVFRFVKKRALTPNLPISPPSSSSSISSTSTTAEMSTTTPLNWKTMDNEIIDTSSTIIEKKKKEKKDENENEKELHKVQDKTTPKKPFQIVIKSSPQERSNFYAKNGEARFSDLGVSDLLVYRLRELNLQRPSIAQYTFIKAYHMFHEAGVLVLGSETGSGKTLAFAIPILDEILEEYMQVGIINTIKNNQNVIEQFILNIEKRPFLYYPKVIVVEPTDELCVQVRGVLSSLVSKKFGIRVECWTEKHRPPMMHCILDRFPLQKGIAKDSAPEVLVVTPKLLRSVFTTKFLLRCSHIVFDEADTMLTHYNGYYQYIQPIFSQILRYHKDKGLANPNSIFTTYFQQHCKYIFVGATLANKRVKVYLGSRRARSKAQRKTPLPEKLMKLFKDALWIITPMQHRLSPNLKQSWIFVRDNAEKQEMLLRSLYRHPAQIKRYVQSSKKPVIVPTLIFLNSVKSAKDCQKCLDFYKIPNAIIHDQSSPEEKEKNLNAFLTKKVPILVTTNILSRGIDFQNIVERVIQLDFAKNVDIYVNRVGRTARAGKKGVAINFFMPNSLTLVNALKRVSQNRERIDQLYKRKRDTISKKSKSKTKPDNKKLKSQSKSIDELKKSIETSGASSSSSSSYQRNQSISFRFNQALEQQKIERRKLKTRRKLLKKTNSSYLSPSSSSSSSSSSLSSSSSSLPSSSSS